MGFHPGGCVHDVSSITQTDFNPKLCGSASRAVA